MVFAKVGLDCMGPFTFAALRSVLSVLGLTLLVGLLQTSGFIAPAA